MLSGWTQLGPSALAGFLASSVECVEALTIILAVGSTRGWREAVGGTATALVVLVAIVGLFGEALEQIRLATLQTACRWPAGYFRSALAEEIHFALSRRYSPSRRSGGLSCRETSHRIG